MVDADSLDTLPNPSETASEGDELQIDEYEITSSPNDFNVLTIVNFIDNGSIALPEYQRNFTWDLKRASRLIESVLLGLPIPQVFLYEEARNRFQILDGQQRLMSVYYFVKQRFPRQEKRAALREIFGRERRIPSDVFSNDEFFENFRLNLLAKEDEKSSRFNGLVYEELNDFKQTLDLRTIRTIIIKQNEPSDDNSSVFEIFDRLNTGGVNLRPQEIRANLYGGHFYRRIYELNKNVKWRQMFGTEQPDKFMTDVEFLVRAAAMLAMGDSYKPSMTRFLNVFSNIAKRRYTNEKSDHIINLLEWFLNSVSEVDPKHFHTVKQSKFSIAVFEAALYGMCKNAWETGEVPAPFKLAPDALEDLRTNPDFAGYSLEGTTKKVAVEGRLRIGKQVMSHYRASAGG